MVEFQEVFEAGQSADILRRRSSFAVDEARVFESWIGVRDGFDGDRVPPLVAVVGTSEG